MNKDGLITGLLITFIGHISLFSSVVLLNGMLVKFGSNGLLGLFGPVFNVSIFFIGLTQWLYLLPLVFWFRRRGLFLTERGIIICGGLTIVINALVLIWFSRLKMF